MKLIVADDIDDDTPLEKNCMTCKHYNRKQQYCPLQDCAIARSVASVCPIFSNGPCDKWECRYVGGAK